MTQPTSTEPLTSAEFQKRYAEKSLTEVSGAQLMALLQEEKNLVRQTLNETVEDTVRRKIEWQSGKVERQRKFWFWFNMAITGMVFLNFIFIFTGFGSWIGFHADWLTPTNTPSFWQRLVPATAPAHTANPEAVIAATRNMMTVLVPLISGVVLWTITVVAERRLKAYDEAIERLTDRLDKKIDDFRKTIEDNAKEQRKSITERLEKFEAESDKKLANFRTEIENRTDKATADIERKLTQKVSALVASAIDSQISRMDQEIEKHKANLEQSVSTVKKLEKDLSDRFGAIADNAGYAKTKRGPLSSVGRVHKEVSELFAEGKRDEAVLMVRDMLEQFRSQTGTLRPAGDLKDDWFNLSAVLGRNDEEGLALEVCLAGLEQQNGAPVFT